ncbi:HlyD family type I secretion periplasmic adaptor subunit [Ideonella sp.]|uniref:HlyD family type I secretion periplasmic adaptor subunit n=1 Tax=Ideonella sp. TaxID=1929293 RepID=UPI003BB76EA7
MSTRNWHAAPEPPGGPPVPVAGLVHAADLPDGARATDKLRKKGSPGPAASGREAARERDNETAEVRRLQSSDLRFLSSVRQAQVLEARPLASASIWLMMIVVALAAAWASLTQVEQITRTEGRVVPDGREQVIASLEGGILRELMVREGAEVRVGQALLRLDPTRFESQQNEGVARQLALKATVARLRAEASGQALSFPPELADSAALTRSEVEAFEARQRLLAEAVSANQNSIALVQRELSVAESMSAQGLMSEVEVMRLKRQIGEMRQQSVERRSRFRQEASTELLKVQSELAQLDEQLVAREDAVRRTVIHSPVNGLVKTIRQNTLGGVVNAGAPIMEIVPQGTRMLVEARIKPADIGFVRVGQKAEVKLSAYDYNLYGGLQGEVEAISPDALGDAERANGGADATWFRALVRIDASSLQANGQALPVRPGMTGTIEINTSERSVLDFILRPLLKAREAFRER